MKKLVLFALIFLAQNSFSQKNEFKADCDEVGNYIHDNAPFTSSYILYNGLGTKKIDVYDDLGNRSLYTIWDSTLVQRLERHRQNDDFLVSTLKADGKKIRQEALKELNRLTTNRFKKESLFFKGVLIPQVCQISSSKNDCLRLVNRVYDLMSVREITASGGSKFGYTVGISLPDFILDLLTDPKYVKGLTYALEDIHTLIEKQKIYSQIVYTNIFVTLEKAYAKAEVVNPKQAAFLTLGVFGTRGASLESFTYFAPNLALTTVEKMIDIFNGMHRLDSQASLGTQMFSIPKMTKNSCVFGKAYHFWLAAFFANHLVQEGESVANSFEAAALAGLIYDWAGLRGADEKITKMKIDSVYVKSIRHSFLFKMAGARFGATGNGNINLDFAYREMLRHSVELKRKESVLRFFLRYSSEKLSERFPTSDLTAVLREAHQKLPVPFDDFLKLTGAKVGFNNLQKSIP